MKNKKKKKRQEFVIYAAHFQSQSQQDKKLRKMIIRQDTDV